MLKHAKCHCHQPHLAGEATVRRLGTIWTVALRTTTPATGPQGQPYKIIARWEHADIPMLAVRHTYYHTAEEAKAAFTSTLNLMHISPKYATTNW